MTPMNDRLGPPPDDMTPAQRIVAQAIIDGPRGALYGPFVPLLRSPELMEHAQAGIAAPVIQAIAQRRRPGGMLVDEAVVHDFCVELHEAKSVSDRVYADALALFGEQGVVDLVGINGYYTFLAMVMNTARTAVPASSAAPMPD